MLLGGRNEKAALMEVDPTNQADLDSFVSPWMLLLCMFIIA